MRFDVFSRQLAGITFWNTSENDVTILTIVREKYEELNLSSPSSCLPRLNSVLVTVLDFFENQSVNTIIIPAINKNNVFDLTGSFKASIVCERNPEPEAATLKELNPARGTPIKFTRSFAAKAIASANVPVRTITFNIFIFVKRVIS